MKIKILIQIIFFIFYAQFKCSNGLKKSSIIIKIEYPKRSGNIIEKDLIEFIEYGKNNMSTSTKYNKAIMVMGMSGTGKSTLVNYLNDIPLVCKKLHDKWIIDLENENITLPGGFSIGHRHQSETFYPSIYSSNLNNFSYVDNPGFRDTRGFAVEIANGYFREQINKDITDLKFLLLITHADLKDRGQRFRDSIKGFSDFLGLFDEYDTKMLNKSIGIIVSRVENDGLSDNELIDIFKNRLLEIIKEEFDAEFITKNEKLVFENIIKNDQIELFSNPKKPGLLNNNQSKKIHNLINNLSYMNKSEAKLRVRISNSHVTKLLDYIKYEKKSLINKTVHFYYKKQNLSHFNSNQFTKVYKKLNDIQILDLQRVNLETLLNSIGDDVLLENIEEKKQLILRNDLLNFFIQLLPEKNRNLNKNETNWLNDELNLFIVDCLDNLYDKFHNEFVNFEIKIETILENNFISYFNKEIICLNNTNDLSKLDLNINDFVNQIKKLNNFESFLNGLNKEIISINNLNELLNDKNNFNEFIEILPKDKKNFYLNKSQWISLDLILKLNNYLIEIKQFYIEYEPIYNKTDNSFTFKTHFGQISSVLNKINNMKDINNLKTIQIYASHSITFDIDFKIDENKYTTNSPDLFIISTRTFVNKHVTVDLSCYKTPNYPDMKKKADNGYQSSQSGSDGKPGLAGFNAGNFILITTYLSNKTNLNHKLIGGKGGPGQNGGDGAEGTKGRDATESDVNTKKAESEKKFKYLFEYEVKGGYGYQGGDGGRAGCGGINGYGGTYLQQIYRENKDEISVFVEEKSFGLGDHGIRGEAGIGGRRGDTKLKENRYRKYNAGLLPESSLWVYIIIPHDNGWITFTQPNDERSLSGSTKFDINCLNQSKAVKKYIESSQINNQKNSFAKFLNELMIKNKSINFGRFLFFEKDIS